MSEENPLLESWNTPFETPPFGQIQNEHFMPAFEAAMADHLAEIQAIASCEAKPDFTNTIEAMERAGKLLARVSAIFFNLAGSRTNAQLQAIERQIAPRLAEHRAKIMLNQDLSARVEAVYASRGNHGLNGEQARVLERSRSAFVRAGANLEGEDRDRMEGIAIELQKLGTRFSQNVLADEGAYELILNEEDLTGLPGFLVSAAKAAAVDRGHDKGYAITLSRSLIEPFLTFSDRRDLREQAFKAWISRGENGGETDNRDIILQTLKLREERARLLGFEDFASFKLEDQMAKTPEKVRELLTAVWEPAKKKALAEARQLQELANALGANFKIAPWDWRYYSEKVRARDYDLDEAKIKPYFQLDNMIAAAFETANRLFGLTFQELDNVPVYHPDVRAFEVKDKNGEHVALFYGDYFARSGKRSGAWMSGFRSQEKLAGDIRPIIVNVMNLARAEEGEPVLLTFDDARTLFHEFGHALHGMLSNVTYPSISGTSVARDFVELPSQLYEHWLGQKEILKRHGLHAHTGEPLPDDVIEKLKAAETFNQGFATVEYTASALVDLELHTTPAQQISDITTVEGKILDTLGMPEEITMRHRSPHFLHVFSGDAYSAGYYSYMWSEVMDADAFRAFQEVGDVFHSETAQRLMDNIYSAGASREAEALYIAFRGEMPKIDALLEGRGLQS